MTMYELIDLCHRYTKLSVTHQDAIDALMCSDVNVCTLPETTLLKLSMFLAFAKRAHVEGADRLHNAVNEQLKKGIAQ